MALPQDDITTAFFDPEEITGEATVALTPGMVLNNKYELLKQIGRGGMGVVWQAKDQVSHRLVALKFVPRELKRFDVEMERVRASFRKVHALNHQWICPMYGLEDGGEFGYYLVMKYLEGETLDRYVLRKDPKRQGLPMDQVIAILSRVAVALDYAHLNKAIHRDIKPGNIFLTKVAGKLHVQLIDFGLVDEIRTSLSRVSQMQFDISGTRPYMAPEQWQGRLQSATTDQYALAVVAYELLAGHLPFQSSDFKVLGNAILNVMPEPIPSISNDANNVLMRALAKDSAGRFGSCQEFVTTLNGVWTSEVSDISSSASDWAAPTVFSMPRWVRAVALSVLLLFAIGAIVFTSSRRDQSPPSQQHVQRHTVARGAPPPPSHSSSFSDIFQAVAGGTVQDIEHFVRSGVSVNRGDNAGNTPLHHAALRGNVELLRYLVSQGARVNERNNSGRTPLHNAAASSTPTVVSYLIAQNANVNARDNTNRTPLDIASTPEKIRILRDAGGVAGETQQITRSGFPDIFQAAARGTVSDVQHFIGRGININQPDARGNTPLHHAATTGSRLEVLQYLVSQRANVDARNSRGETPLHIATQRASGFHPTTGALTVGTSRSDILAILRSLVSPANINMGDRLGNTPLHHAAFSPFNEDVLRHLVSLGADVNARNNVRDTPLHAAARRVAPNTGVLRYLVSQGADVNARGYFGNTPLHTAAAHRTAPNVGILQSLVSQGANVNAVNDDGNTPLHFAAATRPQGTNINPIAAALNYLISQGANVNARNNAGRTPRDVIFPATGAVAEEKRRILSGQQPIPDLVPTPYQSPGRDIFDAAARGTVRDVEHHINNGADVNATDSRGNTPLHHAAAHNPNVEVLRHLLAQEGVNVNARNTANRTPLGITDVPEKRGVLRASRGEE